MSDVPYHEPCKSMRRFIAAVEARLDSLGMSRAELARRIGIDAPAMSKTLRGRGGSCRLTRCDEIARALGYEDHYDLVEANAPKETVPR